MTWLIVPTRWISSSSGSFVDGSIWEERKIRRSKERAASRAATDLSRPTNRGTTMPGKTTMSRRGSSGRIFLRSAMDPPSPILAELGEFDFLPFHDLWLDAPPSKDHVFGDDALADVALRRDLVHHVEHDVLEDGAKAPRAGLPLDRLLGYGVQRLVGEFELHVLEVEQPLVLADQGVFRPGEDLHQGVLGKLVQRRQDRKPPDELGDEAVPDHVLRLGELEELPEIAVRPGDDVRGEPHRLLRGPALDDPLQTDESPPADEEDVRRVDLDELLLRVLPPALRRHIGDRPLEDLEERLLHPFSGDVPGDRRVL